MSITDELRNAAAESEYANGRCEKLYRGDLERIADRIDAALEGYIELPKDADGEYIRVGERVQRVGNDPSTVSHMSLADDGWRVFVKYDGNLGTGSSKPKCIHHVQPDSWERIIEDATALGAQMGRRTMQVGDLVERCKRLAGEGA